MKKIFFLVSLFLLTIPAMSQGKKYNKAMQSAMDQMNQAEGPAGELEMVSSFEEIAEKYPDQWLASYHAARILVVSSFSEPDEASRDALLDRAKIYLGKTEDLAPEESEIQVLKALYFIGIISVEPDTRGPIYYQDAMFAIQKGLDLNPENPRAHYMNGMWTLNTPDFLGGGPDAARPLLLEAQQKFQNYRNEDPFWPSWGEELVQEELDRMKE